MPRAWWQRLRPSSFLGIPRISQSVHPVWHRGMGGDPRVGPPGHVWLQPWGCLYGKRGRKPLPWGWEGHPHGSCPRFKPSLGFLQPFLDTRTPRHPLMSPVNGRKWRKPRPSPVTTGVEFPRDGQEVTVSPQRQLPARIISVPIPPCAWGHFY